VSLTNKTTSSLETQTSNTCTLHEGILDDDKLHTFLSEKNDAKALKLWLTHSTSKPFTSRDDILLSIDAQISQIDHQINDQLNTIIHHPRFQQLESGWRGLWYLADQADGFRSIKIKILDITWRELSRDIDRAIDFDHSQLFHKIYSDEYGTPGGEPYGVLIGDYQVSHKPSKDHPYDDISTLKGIAEIAAASFAPFIAAASHRIFGVESFEELGAPINFDNIFNSNEFISWRSLRDQTDAKFIGLTLPRILMRKPYRKEPGTYKGMFFYEKLDNGREDYLWGNAAYGFAAILIREFASVGWFGHIRGVPRDQIGGGILTNLPVDSFQTDTDDIAYKPSTDVIITDSTERELSNLGFVPLCQCYDTPFTAFFSNQSLQKPKGQNSKINNAAVVNAKLSSMLQHVLCGSRVAHYIKVMIRDKVGSFVSADGCESMLREWLFKYTSGRDDMEWEEQARFPLREAQVSVKEHIEKPGQYYCSIRLVPHYQVDQMVSELELVTELVQSR